MDSKSVAKSKRAHSQHHSTKKHHPKPTKPSSSGKQIPSNWDRYDEESELVGPSDVVLPKSKGADYTHLLSEAESTQSQFDDDDDVLFGEWNKGIMSMLSARGDSIMSSIRDDNFAVDDNTAASHHHHQVSFLSLNLHSLAEQLEKVELSQRLYIDADILPPELNVEGLESTSSQSTDQFQATCIDKGAGVRMSQASTSGEFPDKIDVADQEIEIMISSSPDNEPLDSNLGNLDSISLEQINVDPSELGRLTSQKKRPEVNTEGSMKPFADVPNKKVATFKATTAEEELDMLLDSFCETKLSGLSPLDDEAAVSPLQQPGKGTDSVNLDDELDDLMNKISIPNSQACPSHPQANMPVHDFQPASQTGSKPKELDDFDSWFDTL